MGEFDSGRCRVIVTTDIGGSDADDFQSMVHYLLYSDLFDTEGLISAAWGDGRKSDILDVIDAYEKDYPNLRTWSDRYPEPDELRNLTKQGAVDIAPWKGWTAPTEASELIISCARKPDPRPLHLLMWGLLEDLAQALHDAPDILPKLRVNYIGGPNKKWGQNAYAYINENFPDLWMIEDNSTYRGWFNLAGVQPPWDNRGFVDEMIRPYGHLGTFFTSQLDGVLKMGDTPTVARLVSGDPEDPGADSWGGSFTRVCNMPAGRLLHPVSADSEIEVFSVTEILFDGPETADTEAAVFDMEIRNQHFEGYYLGGGKYGFRFVPKEAGVFEYETHSAIPALDGLKGSVTVVPEIPATRVSGRLTNRWSDRLEEEFSEGPHRGAKTINRWRREALGSFAERIRRCVTPKN